MLIFLLILTWIIAGLGMSGKLRGKNETKWLIVSFALIGLLAAVSIRQILV